MSWPTQQLDKVADFRLGKMLDGKKNKGELMPYLANVNVRWGEFDLTDLREMRFEDHERDTFGLSYGDIVMCEGGEPGRCAIWKDERPGMMIQKALHRIRPHACLDHEFLFYTFLHMGRTGQFAPLFTGATIKYLPREKLELLEIPIPPLSVQRRIADILSAYDGLVENNRRRMALLEESARQLYQEWFVRLRFPGHEHIRITSGVPEGWEQVPMPDAIEINPSTRLSDSPEHRWVEMADLPTDSMVIQNSILREGRSGSKFQNGDTLLARITPCLENGKTGFVNFLAEGEVARGSTEFIVLRSKRLTPEFVYCFARTYHFREHAIKSMVGSSGRQRVQESCFDDYKVCVPPQSFLNLFRELAEPVFRQIKILHTQNQKLRAARDLLLPRLMSGEVAV
jgi:type I restriction enzyme S subunit